MATYKVRIEDQEYEVSVSDAAGGGADVTVEGRTFRVEPTGIAALATAPASNAALNPAAAPAPAAPAPAAAAKPAVGGGGSIHAPIPGVVTKLCVSVGEAVEAHQVVLKLEAMKMENDIVTPIAGVVKEIAVNEGAEVSDAQLLVVVE